MVGAAGFAGRFRLLVTVVHHIVFGDFCAVHLSLVHLFLRGFVFVRWGSIRARIFLDIVLIFFLALRLFVVRRFFRIILFDVIVAKVFGQLHGRQHIADQFGKGLLIFDGLRETGHRLTSFLFDKIPPEINHTAGRSRRFLPGQLLAHHKSHRFFQRSVFLLADAGKICLGIFVCQH